MTRLLDLAPEILTQIAKAVSRLGYPLQNDVDLYRLALTCRTLFNVTEPFLYTKFVQLDKKQVTKFLRTVLEKSGYASKVKLLSLEHTGEDEFEDDEYYEEEDDDEEGDDEDKNARQARKEPELALMTIALDSIGLPPNERPSRAQWIDELAHENQPGLFALLIMSLPNLEVLYVQTDSHTLGAAMFLPQVVQFAASQKPPRHLTSLREFQYSHAYPEHNLDFSVVAPFFYLPSLRKIEAYALSAHEGLDRDPPLTSCNVETLDLSRGGIDGSVWSELLRPLKKLKHFSYSPGNPKHVGFLDLSPMSLGENLPLVKDTLESLSLSEFYPQSDETDLLGSLHDFPTLKCVSIEVALLIGTAEFKAEKALWEYLPASLENLTLWGHESHWAKNREDVFDQIMETALRKESHFPRLKQLMLHQLVGEGKEALKEACLARGVQLVG